MLAVFAISWVAAARSPQGVAHAVDNGIGQSGGLGGVISGDNPWGGGICKAGRTGPNCDVYEPGGGGWTPPPETYPYSPVAYVKWSTPNTVKLQWIDRSKVETGYRVERKDSDGTRVVLETFGPIPHAHLSQTYEVTGLNPNTDYCFHVIAYNDIGDSDAHDVCTHTPPASAKACSGEQIEELLELADETDKSVRMACDFTLQSHDVVTKVVVFSGNTSGIIADFNDATLNGGEGTFNHGRDMIQVRSTETKTYDQNGRERISTYARPTDITIKNGNVIGSVRIWGMASNGEGDGDYEYLTINNMTVKREIAGTNQFKRSSKTLGHTARAQMNAPTRIVLDHMLIRGLRRNPVYFAPGVTHSKLTNSVVIGKSKHVAVYLDAESAHNLFVNNNIDVETGNHIGSHWDRPLIAIDGSSGNKFINNRFSQLSRGGIYLYRNCGDGGVIRHQTPSYNQVINNVFYYNKYGPKTVTLQNGQRVKVVNPSVYFGSRDRGLLSEWFSFCDDDDGKPFGSSASNKDHAQYNVVAQNQIHKNSPEDMIKAKNLPVNSPNYVLLNETVTEETVDPERRAGCYVGREDGSFILDGASLDVYTSTNFGLRHTCSDGRLTSRPILRMSDGGLSKQTLSLTQPAQTGSGQLVSEKASQSISVSAATMDGELEDNQSSFDRTVKGDFNGDNQDDVAIFYSDAEDGLRIVVLLSTGEFRIYPDGEAWWDSGAGYDADEVTGRLVSGDFNGDGLDDIAMFYRYDDNWGRIHVLLSTGDAFTYQGDEGWWDSGLGYNADDITGRMVSGDFNNDSYDDIAMLYQYDDDLARMHVLLSTGESFTYQSDAGWWHNGLGYDGGDMTGRMMSDDVDDDGYDDIIIFDGYDGELKVLRSTGSAFSYQGDERPLDVAPIKKAVVKKKQPTAPKKPVVRILPSTLMKGKGSTTLRIK